MVRSRSRNLGMVKVTVGEFGNCSAKTAVVPKNASIADAFTQCGFNIHSDESILTINAKKVGQKDRVKNNETYLLHTKYQSG